jgi:hypothetical protein
VCPQDEAAVEVREFPSPQPAAVRLLAALRGLPPSGTMSTCADMSACSDASALDTLAGLVQVCPFAIRLDSFVIGASVNSRQHTSMVAMHRVDASQFGAGERWEKIKEKKENLTEVIIVIRAFQSFSTVDDCKCARHAPPVTRRSAQAERSVSSACAACPSLFVQDLIWGLVDLIVFGFILGFYVQAYPSLFV